MNKMSLQLCALILCVLGFCFFAWSAVQCPNCGFDNSDQDRYCLNCNTEIRELTAKERDALSQVKISVLENKHHQKKDQTGEISWGWLLIIILVCVAFVASLKARVEEKKRKSAESSKSEMKVFLSLDPKSGGEVRAARRFSRKEVKINACYQIGDGEKIKTQIVDLSLTGAGIIADADIAKDTKILIYLPNKNEEMKLSGLVMNAKKIKQQYVVGIQFFHLFKHQEAYIEQVLLQYKS